MTKILKVLAMMAAAVALAAPCVLADSVEVKASIPFEFTVADRHLPSGEYRFVTGEGDHGLVQVFSKTGEHVATLLCRPMAAAKADKTVLSFDKHGDGRFLKSIRIGDGSGVYLPETRLERETEAQARAMAAGATSVAAQ